MAVKQSSAAAASDSTHPARWWQTAVVYQVYPRSFQDTNGDGVGDLPGVMQRLDYLQSLGIDAIWLSPFYPSPMRDFGYDISDYRDVHPIFGTMADFDELLEETHRRKMKLLVDLVPNHTSDEHPWFMESRSSRENPRRDWYVWRDPAPDGGPPNNWISVFGGPAWTLDELTGQYYLHQFLKEQPDLNYRNPRVLDAILDVMRFWLDRGVDGFRVDVVNMLVEDEQFRNEPPDPGWDGVDPYFSLVHYHTTNQPETHAVLRRMRQLLDQYDDRVMIGEAYVTNADLVTYYGPNLNECHLPFNFQLIFLRWAARAVRAAVDAYEAVLPEGAWPNWVLGNHDRRRVASRVGSELARLSNMLLLTLRGTPTTYYGEEIGMEDVPVSTESTVDPAALNKPEIARIVGRDPARTPMQWDGGPGAGFTVRGVTPWLPLPADYTEHNVFVQDRDPASMLSLYRTLARLRRAERSLHLGAYTPLDVGVDDIFAYERSAPDCDRFLVVLNFGTADQTLDLSEVSSHATIEVDTRMVREGSVNLSRLLVGPQQGLVLRMD